MGFLPGWLRIPAGAGPGRPGGEVETRPGLLVFQSPTVDSVRVHSSHRLVLSLSLITFC